MKKLKMPTIAQLNYASSLAKQLGVDQKYCWEQGYWTEEELLAVTYGLEKRFRCG
jgi:hypothetical protein